MVGEFLRRALGVIVEDNHTAPSSPRRGVEVLVVGEVEQRNHRRVPRGHLDTAFGSSCCPLKEVVLPPRVADLVVVGEEALQQPLFGAADDLEGSAGYRLEPLTRPEEREAVELVGQSRDVGVMGGPSSQLLRPHELRGEVPASLGAQISLLGRGKGDGDTEAEGDPGQELERGDGTLAPQTQSLPRLDEAVDGFTHEGSPITEPVDESGYSAESLSQDHGEMVSTGTRKLKEGDGALGRRGAKTNLQAG